ncbi:MAG TPA: ROK family protein [Paludibacteraceae bacterium]|nr:ROK family protein [Paludibacteraceae bacterium]HQB69393.1 ROK family protein [Paludibacteraceae bacterium]HRS67847.1 ROK family protein [Paludibacteraceae bacterium]
MEKSYVVGIDIGGQTAKIGVVDMRGNVLAQSAIRSNDTTDHEEFITKLCTAVTELVNKSLSIDQIRGIGIGAPNGNYYKGTIENAVNLTWGGNATSIPFAELMSEQIGVPVKLTNDANAAAVGEMTYGVARGMKNFIMITLGTGVGSGIVIDGHVLYGHDGFAGELGHVTMVRNNGRICGCGKTGCLESYASATGVARTARELIETTDKKSLLRNIPAENITSKDVFEAAQQDDELAKDIFDFTGKMLGEAFADFVAFSSPEAIILFGGLTKSGDLIMKPIVESLNHNLMPLWKGKVKVLFSQLKESDAAILGASALAWEL